MLHVIPSINCPSRDFQCVERKVRLAESFSTWAHLDIADGAFTFAKSWNDPEAWGRLYTKLTLEVHLMLVDPMTAFEEWLKAGAKRIIVHVESLDELARRHGGSAFARARELGRLAAQGGASFMLAINPETPAYRLTPFLGMFSEFQILAVHAGPAGQRFLPIVIPKIQWLREHAPDATIEVDGGIVPETARLVREAGADIVVAGSYTLGSEDPKGAYEELCNS